MEKNIMLLNAKSYNFVDKKTGEVIQGVTINYVPMETIKTNNGIVAEQFKGLAIIKQSLDLEKWQSITSVPAIYTADIQQEFFKNALHDKVVDLRFLKAI